MFAEHMNVEGFNRTTYNLVEERQGFHMQQTLTKQSHQGSGDSQSPI